ncbi:MAG: hypothetical protein R3F61_30210 [Myxococcota bacterium]
MSDEPTVLGVLRSSGAAVLEDPVGVIKCSVIPGVLLLLWVGGLYASLIGLPFIALLISQLLEDELALGVVFYGGLVAGVGITVPVVVGCYVGVARAIHSRMRSGEPLGLWSPLTDLGRGVFYAGTYLVGSVLVTGVFAVGVGLALGWAVGSLVSTFLGIGWGIATGYVVAYVALALMGIVVNAPLSMMFGEVVLNQRPFGAALRLSVSFALARPGYAMRMSLAIMAVVFLSQLVPMIGIGLSCYLYVDLLVRSYVAWFGLGDEPEVQHVTLTGIRGLS